MNDNVDSRCIHWTNTCQYPQIHLRSLYCAFICLRRVFWKLTKVDQFMGDHRCIQMYFPHGLIASLNCISLITNTSSFYFVSKVYNIRDIVHYRILAIESATVCFFSLLSCILNVSITLDLNPFSDGYKCAFLTVTTGIPLFIGVVSSALTAFFRSV